jgi:hypothetical protein
MRVRHDHKSQRVRGTEKQVSIFILGVVGIELG